MSVTITRPFNPGYKDPFEITIEDDEEHRIVLHAKDRTASDAILIALIDHLQSFEIQN